MITDEQTATVRGWFTGRLPQEWTATAAPDVRVDREEITVVLTIPDVGASSEVPEGAERDAARIGRAKAFREDTRETRMGIADEAERHFDRKVSWGVSLGAAAGEGKGHRELWTHVSAPVMTRLRQPERLVLDTLVESGVARSRSDALGWCVRLVAQHEGDWLGQLREAMTSVADVRRSGPAA